MTRHVFDNAQCAHVWAQQSQEHGRSNSMSFQGEMLLSYRTPIARIVKAPSGERVALITSHTYSMTTSSKHMPAVRSAVTHLPSFYVPNLATPDMHTVNMEYFSKRYQEDLVKLSRAKERAEWRIADLARQRQHAMDYVRTFGLSFEPEFWATDFPAPDETLLAEVRARANKASAAKAEATRKRNLEKLKAVQLSIDSFIAGDYDVLPWNWYYFATDEQKKQVTDFALNEWRHGIKLNLRNICYTGNKFAAVVMRLKDAKTIETSQGAEFPVEHAKLAYPVIKKVREGEHVVQDYRPRLGAFHIDSIDEEGNVTAGCHRVMWHEIERMAKQLGLAA